MRKAAPERGKHHARERPIRCTVLEDERERQADADRQNHTDDTPTPTDISRVDMRHMPDLSLGSRVDRHQLLLTPVITVGE